MKKINGLLIFGLAIVLGLVIACEQERLQEDLSPKNNEIESRNAVVVRDNVLLEDDIMSFADELTFEGFMNYLDSVGIESFLALVNSYGYTSYCDPTLGPCAVTSTGEEIDEPELMAILNEYSMVHIGDYLIKLNFEEENAYVLPDDISDLELQQFQLAESAEDVEAILSTPGVEQIYQFNENVFDIINGTHYDDDDDPAALSFCNAADQDGDFSCANQSCDPRCNFDFGCVTAEYSGFAIWFSMEATFSYSDCFRGCPNSVSYSLDIDANWNRCGPGGVGSQNSTTGEDTCFTREVVYSGTRRLRSYNMSVSATYSCRGGNFFTGVAQIAGG